ncbi:lycopene cyclase domain-containing protein [Cryobacterium sp. TMT1-3]|uniref:Lycopene cyclase domain-containing protein n=1 Tax=Cryobacterium luteum TaxID=1424661 RepID=A0A1H8GUS4_9MICO|nr:MULTISPECIES: lycopene cyclase domain-containing protein [Cryobacterium]TFB84592.1 lycopene cyclase domain-containing protein [Cryobacterium luteum]TFC28460.1 lycopene cyclase domain-containing protein [Cryobacterium sp. TMT1-3]SEN47529.1 lycopene cyclase domain-containing protein [Cryobacterium luteum]
MSVLYLLTLLVSLAGMIVLDWRFRLFFWRSPGRAAIVLGAGVLFFLAWDLLGIGLGIFYRGETELMTGLQLAPELPVEELFFLTFLCYLTMNLVQGARLVLDRRTM